LSVYYFYRKEEPVPFRYLTPSRMAGELPSPYEAAMTPNAYLEFAIADFGEGSERGLVNAFGNTKRALHLKIDTLLNQYGLFAHFRRLNFPEKLKVLDDIGILPITIIKNLNVERNLLEHEYVTPSKRRVAEAIDVVKLLLLATEKLIEKTPYEVVVGWKNPKRHIVLQLEPIKGVMNLFTLKAKGKYKKINGISCFSSGLRTFTGETINPGIKLSKKPWRVITLNKAGINEWKPILAELVNIQRQQRTHDSYIDKGAATVTIPITVPLGAFGALSWVDIMDNFLKKGKEHTEGKK
jgi:hypothetical protein